MPTHKVAELEGALLDAAVAKAAGIHVKRIGFYETLGGQAPVADVLGRWDEDQMNWVRWNPSTDWRDGGPIIERERIDIRWTRDGYWNADIGDGDTAIRADGLIILIAAMRAYVASKFGIEVELP